MVVIWKRKNKESPLLKIHAEIFTDKMMVASICFKIIQRLKKRVRSEWGHTWNKIGHELIAVEDGGWRDGDSLFSLFLYMLERSHDPNMFKNWR